MLFATIPTLLYHLGIVLAIGMDSRRYDTHGVELELHPGARRHDDEQAST